jgi:hypothetical protein
VHSDLRELKKLGFAVQLPDKRWVAGFRRIEIRIPDADGVLEVEGCPGSPLCPRSRDYPFA